MSTITELQYWYAIRVTYNRELLVKTRLDERGIVNYLPMRLTERIYAGRRRRVWVPAVHNLIFVHIAPGAMRELKSDPGLPIRYIIDPATRAPAIIPDRQMEDFMAVLATGSQQVEVVDPKYFALAEGDPVRVVKGPFAGIEGRYIRHKGRGKVVVEAHGVAAVLTAFIPMGFIEKLPLEPFDPKP